MPQKIPTVYIASRSRREAMRILPKKKVIRRAPARYDTDVSAFARLRLRPGDLRSRGGTGKERRRRTRAFIKSFARKANATICQEENPDEAKPIQANSCVGIGAFMPCRMRRRGFCRRDVIGKHFGRLDDRYDACRRKGAA